MKFRWETEKEKIKKYLAMSTKNKLEWLYDINEFLFKYTRKNIKSARRNLKKSR